MSPDTGVTITSFVGSSQLLAAERLDSREQQGVRDNHISMASMLDKDPGWEIQAL